MLLELAAHGVSREQAYSWVQRNALRSFDEKLDFKTLLLADPDITGVLSRDEIDLLLLQERRPPLATASLLIGLIAWFGILEGAGGILYFPDFLRYSLEISAGYSDAMGLEGSRLELLSFLALTIVCGLFVFGLSTSGM